MKRILLPMLALLMAPAVAMGGDIQSYGDGPSIVHLNTDKMMTMVLVDGAAMVEQGDCSTPKACDVYDVAPGKHEFDIRSGLTAKKVLYSGLVEIPGSAEVWVKIRGGQAEIYNVQPRKDLVHSTTVIHVEEPAVGVSTSTTHSTTTTTTVDGVPGISAGITVTDPDTGEEVSVSAGIGGIGIPGGVTVTETTVTETHHGGGSGTTYVEETVSGYGTLEFTSTDGESFTIFIDGKERATFNGLDGQSIKVRRVEAGKHKLVIKDFMGDETWAAGHIWVEPNFVLKLGVSETEVETFNGPSDVWIRRY